MKIKVNFDSVIYFTKISNEIKKKKKPIVFNIRKINKYDKDGVFNNFKNNII